MKKLTLCLILLMSLFSCDQFNYNHFQVLESDYHDINKTNISRLKQNIIGDTLSLAIIGDSQRYYNSTEILINKINHFNEINFIAHTGDLVDFGNQNEFILMHELLSTLNKPYISVVGNHDLIGNGETIYNQIYGELNFSFYLKKNKFIYLNTNSREYGMDGVPNLNWLDKELSDTINYDNAIIICHVSHKNVDFSPSLRDEYVNTLARYNKTLLSINGHNHQFSFSGPDQHGISYLNTSSTATESFILLKIWNKEYSYEIIK